MTHTSVACMVPETDTISDGRPHGFDNTELVRWKWVNKAITTYQSLGPIADWIWWIKPQKCEVYKSFLLWNKPSVQYEVVKTSFVTNRDYRWSSASLILWILQNSLCMWKYKYLVDIE